MAASSMITALTVGSARLGQAPPRLEKRLASARPEASAVAQRLATKSQVAERVKAETALEMERRVAAAQARRARVAASVKLSEQQKSDKLERKLEAGTERAAAHVASRRFKAADVLMKAKAVNAQKPVKAAAAAAATSAELAAAEARHVAHLDQVRAKAAAVTARHAMVVERMREKTETERTELMNKINQRSDSALVKRLTHVGLNMTRNIAHTIHVLHVGETKSTYEAALKEYGQTRLDAAMRRAELLRELHIDAIRSKASAVVDHAKDVTLSAKEQLEASLSLTSRSLNDKMERAATRVRLITSGAMLPKEKLSICGAFIIGTDQKWRPVPERGATPDLMVGLEEGWEEVQSPSDNSGYQFV